MGLGAAFERAATAHEQGSLAFQAYARDLASAQALVRRSQEATHQANQALLQAGIAEHAAGQTPAAGGGSADVAELLAARARASSLADQAAAARANALSLASEAQLLAGQAAARAAGAFSAIADSARAAPTTGGAAAAGVVHRGPRLVTVASMGWQPPPGPIQTRKGHDLRARPASPPTHRSGGFWQAVTSGAAAVGGFLDHEGRTVWHDLANLASHPGPLVRALGDTAGTALGLLGVTVGGLGEGFGLGLDASGIGALAGVPAGVASAGLITASGGFTIVEAHRLGGDIVHLASGVNEGSYRPTSRTFTEGKQVRVRLGDKVFNVHVDAEPDSDNVHLQLNIKGDTRNFEKTRMDLSKPFEPQIPPRIRRALSKRELEQVLSALQKAKRWLQSVNGAGQ